MYCCMSWGGQGPPRHRDVSIVLSSIVVIHSKDAKRRDQQVQLNKILSFIILSIGRYIMYICILIIKRGYYQQINVLSMNHLYYCLFPTIYQYEN